MADPKHHLSVSTRLTCLVNVLKTRPVRFVRSVARRSQGRSSISIRYERVLREFVGQYR